MAKSKSRVLRILLTIGLIAVAVVLPVMIIDGLIGKFAGNAMILGLLIGIMGSMVGGTRRMLYVAPFVALAAGLGAFTAYGWWWVVLLSITGIIAGGGIRFGWLPTLLMLPTAATFASKVTTGKDAVIYGVVAGIAAVYGIVIARRFKAPNVIEGQRVALPTAVIIAAGLGAALAISAAIGVALQWTEPYWVPEPIIILTLYIIMGKRERIKEKFVATSVGVILALPFAFLTLPSWVISVLASLTFILAIGLYKKSYTIYYALFTFALVLALSTPGDVGTEAAHRGSEILMGIVILAAGLAIVHTISSWMSKHYPEPALS